MPNPGWRIECPARQSGGTNGRNAANCGRLSASFTQSFSDNPLLRWLSRAKEGTDCDRNGCYGSPATLRTARAPRGAHVANKTVTPRAATWTATDSAGRVHGNGAFPGRLAGPGASPQPIHARATARTRSATALHAGRAPVSLSVYSTTRILAPHKDGLDGRSGSGGMMIYFDVMMIVTGSPAPARPNPGTTPVRATVARNYTARDPPTPCRAIARQNRLFNPRTD